MGLGNARKNEKHGVTQAEAEQVFVNEPLLLLPILNIVIMNCDFMPSERHMKNAFCTSHSLSGATVQNYGYFGKAFAPQREEYLWAEKP